MTRAAALLLTLTLATTMTTAQDKPDPLQTRPERTNFEETSRYDDLTAFLTALAAKSPLVRTMSFGTTEQGRAMPLVTLSNPAVARPADKPAGRPVVFLLANIHGGEVEGKEAVQVLMRRLTSGDLRPLLDRLVIVIAPNYNADGNEAIDVMNRTAQYGPIAGVGSRENAKGLDLNRDYMKLESAEARALAAAFTAWDPHLVVDLHTTNGSYHGYHLTQSIPLNYSLSRKTLDYHRNTMMASIMKSLDANHNVRAYYYGNFGRGNAAPGELRRWSAFDWRPRAGQNYVGFRNRLTILSEAYSYLSFKRRIEVTERFVEEILKYVDGHRAEIVVLTKSLDDEWIRRAQGTAELPLGVEYEMTPLPKPVEILVGEVKQEMNPRNQRNMTVAIEDSYKPEPMQDYAYFMPTRTVPMARVYVLPSDAAFQPVVDKIRQHGITIDELAAPLTTDVASFVVDAITKSARAFQGHNEVKLKGQYVTEKVTLPAGTKVVRLAQPLGLLAAYLLEPESDDGLTNWNFLDPWLEAGKPAPIRKVMVNVGMKTK
ncbi:MAG TPA: M14 family zinc carboxypeptidase [Vicinamibacterales bacterium]|nr:M14 family zinc carboxypeptidase [Vicinamibacterales bacterium]